MQTRRVPNAVALIFPVLLASLLLLPAFSKEQGPRVGLLAGLVLVAALQILTWQRSRRSGEAPRIELNLVRAHWVQLLAHNLVLVYWALYWPEAFQHIPQLIAQILFAYAFEMALAWGLGRTALLSLAPFPICYSINFFVWFDNDHFILQILLIVVAYLAKTFITWERDGRRRHIFNPSAFPLFFVAMMMVLRDTSAMTRYGEVGASFAIGPNFFEIILLTTLWVGLWFETAIITIGACLALSIGFFIPLWLYGQPLTFGTPFDVTDFLGITLLVTDPATSPKGRTAKFLFGLIYGALIYLTYVLLIGTNSITGVGKILPVPILNLLVPKIERWGERLSNAIGAFVNESTARVLSSRHTHAVVWLLLFCSILPALKTFTLKPLRKTASIDNPMGLEVQTRIGGKTAYCQGRPLMCGPFGLYEELLLDASRGSIEPLFKIGLRGP